MIRSVALAMLCCAVTPSSGGHISPSRATYGQLSNLRVIEVSEFCKSGMFENICVTNFSNNPQCTFPTSYCFISYRMKCNGKIGMQCFWIAGRDYSDCFFWVFPIKISGRSWYWISINSGSNKKLDIVSRRSSKILKYYFGLGILSGKNASNRRAFDIQICP